ncbi:MAG: hypothetical protein RMN52_17145 [Anaerolineae bacterium]|nr:DUF5060 domain-containing protein [Candidatus Roseilinea sp.]MDW8451725.1 hypothetical protein [Anaerolineae bacterium]
MQAPTRAATHALLSAALIAAGILTPGRPAAAQPRMRIEALRANADRVGLYEKFELTFRISGSVATNPYFPYDPAPPPGVPAGVGITVEGLFSPDNWATTIAQPGFLYQAYERRCIGGDPANGCEDREWLYPQGEPVWKVRFAPQRAGLWRYRVRATDASGAVQSREGTFIVTASTAPHNHGFVRISPTDRGYFEYSDGTPFIGVGHGEGFAGAYHADAVMQRLATGRVNFVRVWMSGASIYMAPWNPWHSHHLPGEGGYFNASSLTYTHAYSGHLVSLRLWDYSDPGMDGRRNPCMFQGFTDNIAVRPGTTYQLSIRAKTINVSGPRDANYPRYGLTVRRGGWLGERCAEPAATEPASTRLLGYINGSTPGWITITAMFTTQPDEFFLDNLYLILENTTGGQAFVDEVSIRELAGGKPSGPEVLRKHRFAYHLYFDQKPSWLWDHYFEAAEAHGVTIRPVVLEKNDWIANHIDAGGKPVGSYYELDNNRFYAAPNTAVRRFHEYFWRYLIARWGYSRAVHSWELLNEGDPFNGNHYAQANAFGEFMHTHDVHPHLVTTSHWHSFPVAEFWGNSAYPHVDYADIHAYACCGAVVAGWAQNIGEPLSFERRPAYVAGGQGHSVRIPGNVQFNNAGSTPRWLTIRGRGEWVIRYQMKAEGFTGQCPYGAPAAMAGPRLLWILEDRANVVPAAPSGQNFVCSAPAGTYDWRTFDSRYAADGKPAPLDARLIITDDEAHALTIFFQNSFGTGGNAWIDNVELVAPDGRRVDINGEFDLTRLDHDSAQLTAAYSLAIGGRAPSGPGKPVTRGEVAIGDERDYRGDREHDQSRDTQGVWLHNFIWGQINPGGLYELYWDSENIRRHDLYYHFKAFRDFMDGIPLTNGRYADAQATASHPDLRVLGQVDRVARRGHVWIHNRQHTWRNVVDGVAVKPIAGSINIPNLAPGTYRVIWWDTWQGRPALTQTLTTSGRDLVVPLPEPLHNDIALRFEPISK